MTDQGNSIHRGWYSRGYLPHRDHPGLLQAITYRLADSLPADILARMEEETISKDKRWQKDARRQRLERWLDLGHGSCILRDSRAAALVVETWRRFAGERYDLIAWVVMPNHVHVLVRTYEGVLLAKIVQSWKNFSARKIRELLNDGEQNSSSFWMREYWDRFIRSERHFSDAVTYIHNNPVVAGLVNRAEEWQWSSAQEFSAVRIADFIR